MIESTYSKLFQCILTSSIWQEDDATRLIWITLLALKNRFGEVSGSIPGIAHAAKVPLPAAEKAIKKLLSPDPYSRSKEFDGRRIEVIEGGWRVLNHGKYRDAMNEDERRAYKARWAKERRRIDRERRQGVDKSGQMSTHTDTDTKHAKSKKPRPPHKIPNWDHGKYDGDAYRFGNGEPTKDDQELLDYLSQ